MYSLEDTLVLLHGLLEGVLLLLGRLLFDLQFGKLATQDLELLARATLPALHLLLLRLVRIAFADLRLQFRRAIPSKVCIAWSTRSVQGSTALQPQLMQNGKRERRDTHIGLVRASLSGA